MLILRDPESVSHITDPDIRTLAEQRFNDMCDGEEYDPDVNGYLIVVEVGDSVETLESETGCPFLHNLCNSIRYGEPGFSPVFEVLEDYGTFYELVFIPGGGDFGVVIFIPKQDGIDADLLAMCEEYAVPSP